LLADADGGVIAAAHAGWRGTVAGVVGRTVARMQQDFGSKPGSIRAAIGPSIGKCCFEVGPEVAEQFHARVNASSHVDLVAANFRQLLDAGLHANHVDIAELCTMCGGSLFHSYRRDRELAGRMVAAIRIERQP